MSCNRMPDEDNKPRRRIGVARSSEDIPTPPPPGFVSPYDTIGEWLEAVCAGAPPQKAIAEFSFLLFGVTGNYLLCLAGYNTYWEDHCEIRQIDFEPAPMFFALPERFYTALPMDKVRDKVLHELVVFTQTQVFNDSFLSKGFSITTSFSEDIWPTNYNE